MCHLHCTCQGPSGDGQAKPELRLHQHQRFATGKLSLLAGARATPPPSPTPSMTARIKQLSCLGGPPSACLGGWVPVGPVREGGGGSRECRAQFPQTQNGNSGMGTAEHTLVVRPWVRATAGSCIACQVPLACLRVLECAAGWRDLMKPRAKGTTWGNRHPSKQKSERVPGATCPPNTAPHLGRGVAAVRAAVDLLYLPVRPLMGGHHRAAPGRELAVPESRGNVGK